MWIFKRFIQLLISLFLLIGGYLLLAIAFAIIPAHPDQPSLQKEIEVFIWSNGVHTDFVVPIQTSEMNWRSHFPFHHFRRVSPTVSHIAFGWGDRQFYMETPTWKDLDPTTGFSALFLQGDAAMHVAYLQNPLANPNRRRLLLSSEQYQQLVHYIFNSFEHDANGQVIWIPHKGYGTHDAFYEAVGSFSFLKTCNEWTGQGLRGIPVQIGHWTPFVFGVFYHLSK